MMERKKYFRLIKGVIQTEVDVLTFPDGADVGDFRKAVVKEYERFRRSGIRASALKVFVNSEAQKPLDIDDSLDAYGVSKENPIIVEEPGVWYQLTEAGSRAPFADTTADSVPLTEDDTIGDVRNAVFAACQAILPNRVPSQLLVYKNLTTCNSNEPLDIHSQIESLGRTEETALVVTVPVQVRTRARVGSKEEVDEVPTKRRKVDASSSKWEWKEDEPVYSVEGGTLFFVNRDRAMQQLLESHKSNFYRAVTGSGSTWIIPLVDQVLGLGKTELGGEYIRRCRHEWDILSETDKTEGTFMDIIHRCHMIRIQFSQNDLTAWSLTVKKLTRISLGTSTLSSKKRTLLLPMLSVPIRLGRTRIPRLS